MRFDLPRQDPGKGFWGCVHPRQGRHPSRKKIAIDDRESKDWSLSIADIEEVRTKAGVVMVLQETLPSCEGLLGVEVRSDPRPGLRQRWHNCDLEPGCGDERQVLKGGPSALPLQILYLSHGARRGNSPLSSRWLLGLSFLFRLRLVLDR